MLAAVLLGHGQRAGAGAGLPPRGGAAADTQAWQQGVRISIIEVVTKIVKTSQNLEYIKNIPHLITWIRAVLVLTLEAEPQHLLGPRHTPARHRVLDMSIP